MQDPVFQSLNKKNVTQIVLLSGTNYIDAVYSGSQAIQEAEDLLHLID